MTKEHKKMYKAGKYWAVATLVSASILMEVGVTTHADAIENNKYDGTANVNIDCQANVDGKIISTKDNATSDSTKQESSVANNNATSGSTKQESSPASADNTDPTRVEIEAQGNQKINALWSQYQQALQEREDAWEQGQGNRFSPAYMTADAKAGATYQEWLRAQTRLGDDLHNYDVAQWQREQDQQQANQPSQQPQQTQQVTTTQASQSSSDQPQTEVTKTDQPNQPNISQPDQPDKPAGKTSFDSENSPVIPGYTASKPASDSVDGLTQDSKDNVQTIVYTKNPATDNNGGTEPNQPGKPGNGMDTGNPSSNQPGNPSQPSNATNNGVINTSTNTGSKVNNGAVNSPELPQTGENNSQSQTMSFIGILLAMFGSLLGFLGIKKRHNA